MTPVLDGQLVERHWGGLVQDGAKRGGSRTAIVRPTVYAAGFRFSVNVTR